MTCPQMIHMMICIRVHQSRAVDFPSHLQKHEQVLAENSYPNNSYRVVSAKEVQNSRI